MKNVPVKNYNRRYEDSSLEILEQYSPDSFVIEMYMDEPEISKPSNSNNRGPQYLYENIISGYKYICTAVQTTVLDKISPLVFNIYMQRFQGRYDTDL